MNTVRPATHEAERDLAVRFIAASLSVAITFQRRAPCRLWQYDFRRIFWRMVRLGHRDLRDALELVHAASSIDSAEPFPQATVDLLARVVPGELVSYTEWDIRERPRATMAIEQPVVPTPSDVVEARREYCCSYPISGALRSSETRALKISDFLSLKELHRLDYYDYVLRPFRIEHQMRLWVSAPAGVSRFFSFSRRGAERDFGERDRGLLELLRPFL